MYFGLTATVRWRLGTEQPTDWESYVGEKNGGGDFDLILIVPGTVFAQISVKLGA
jgi:hypothetical protein